MACASSVPSWAHPSPWQAIEVVKGAREGILSIVRIVRSHQAFGTRDAHLSGFWWQFVGLYVGFLGLPDKGQPSDVSE